MQHRKFAALTVLVMLASFAVPRAAFSQIMITEFVADNSGGLQDEDGDSPDWVEIYNNDASPVDLSGYSFSDNSYVPKKWVR